MDISNSYVCTKGIAECCVTFHACFHCTIEGDTNVRAFLVHGKILLASCSSNEVGTTYFYLRWEKRPGIHNTCSAMRR